MVAFQRILALIKENPGLEELVIIFVTDGHDCQDYYRGNRKDYARELLAVAKQIQTLAGLKTQYMSIGFSQQHDAAQMNQIANFGSDQGNFMFVNTDVAEYQAKITEALGDSLDIALGSNSAVKFRIENQQEKYESVSPAAINYVVVVGQDAHDGEQQEEDEDMEALTQCEVLVTVQQIQKTALLNDLLTVTMLTKSGEHECSIKVDTC